MKKCAFAVLVLASSVAAHAADFQLRSDDIADNQPLRNEHVLNGFGCSGANISPALEWTAGPEGTKSYAITVFDPDAPSGSGWWHWTVVNIPASTRSLLRNAGDRLPAGAVQGRTDFGTARYGGACPPAGDKAHRYQFTVWALKTDKLTLDEQSSGAMVGFTLSANALAKSTITPVYGRLLIFAMGL